MKQAPTAQDDVLSVDTTRAAEMLGISRRMLYELIYSGEIPTTQVPSHRSGTPNKHLIEVSELKAFLARHRQVPVTTTPGT
jgi:excisionase family DNA binding protein